MESDQCIFCQIIQGEAKSYKVKENEFYYAFLDINPVNRYHTLVIPKNHYRDLFDIPEEELREVISGVHQVAKLYEEKLELKNAQIVCSSGAEAQQDVFHIHFHIIPRSQGDGQNIRWQTHPEFRKDFDTMLEKITG